MQSRERSILTSLRKTATSSSSAQITMRITITLTSTTAPSRGKWRTRSTSWRGGWRGLRSNLRYVAQFQVCHRRQRWVKLVRISRVTNLTRRYRSRVDISNESPIFFTSEIYKKKIIQFIEASNCLLKISPHNWQIYPEYFRRKEIWTELQRISKILRVVAYVYEEKYACKTVYKFLVRSECSEKLVTLIYKRW